MTNSTSFFIRIKSLIPSFVRAIGDIFFRPWISIKAFNEQKRELYILFIYVFMSFLLCLLTTVIYYEDIEKVSDEAYLAMKNDFKGQVSLFETTRLDSSLSQTLRQLPNLNNETIDSVLASRKIKTDWFNTRVLNTIVKLRKGELHITDLYLRAITYLSYSFMILIPVFAYILIPFYKHKNYTFPETLVFSSFLHVFIFGFLTLLMILYKIIGISPNGLSGMVYSAIFIYLIITLKHLFAESWLITLAKSIALFLAYTVFSNFLMLFLILRSMV